MKKIFTSVMLALAMSLSVSAQTEDATSYIANPSFESNGFESWVQSGMQTQTNSDFAKKEGTVYVEKWVAQTSAVGEASVTQVVKELPLGKYVLIVGAMHFNQGSPETNYEGAYIFAGDAKTPVYAVDDYRVEFSNLTGEVEIGFKSVGGKGNWVACDNFRLEKTGEVTYDEVKPALDALIADAEKISGKMSDQCSKSLADAITAAKAVNASTAMTDVQKVIDALNKSINDANESIATFAALDKEIAKCAEYDGKAMNAQVAQAFGTALAAAKAITSAASTAEVVAAIEALQVSAEKAQTSAAEYAELKAAIDRTNSGATTDAAKEAVKTTVAEAETMYSTGSGDAEEVAAMVKALDDCLLAYNIKNATGNEPIVTTNPFIARGSRLAFGRLSVDANGEKILEQGFCWSEDADPSVLDNRSSEYYSHKGNIYVMRDIKPATKYYVRAYAITQGYKVGYGEAIKVVTLPNANSTWSWERNDATDEEDARCILACSEAINNYNLCSGIRGFHLSAHYVKGAGAGGGTADCSYGGWMRISQNTPYQRTGTVQHETNHGVGVGTSSRWWDENLRADGNRGIWLGRRANELVNFFEDTPGNIRVTGDKTHMWATDPTGKVKGLLNYGINGANEDSGYQLLYYANAMLTEYICEDGLNPTTSYVNGMPCYTFDFDENKKYYLVNEDPERGCLAGGMLSAQDDKFRWSENAKPTDYHAWNIEYNYEEGMYRFKNVATGKYMGHTGKSLAYKESGDATAEFQLFPSRMDVNMGSSKMYGYWLAWNNSSSPVALRANEMTTNGYGVYTGANINIANTARNQRFYIVSEDDIDTFLQEAAGMQTIVAAPAERTVVGIYTIDGRSIGEMHKGVNIVRYSDGTTEKVIGK